MEALHARGLTPIVVSTPGEALIARGIPAAQHLTGQINFSDIADLGRTARFTVGNDNGPMHLFAALSRFSQFACERRSCLTTLNHLSDQVQKRVVHPASPVEDGGYAEEHNGLPSINTCNQR